MLKFKNYIIVLTIVLLSSFLSACEPVHQLSDLRDFEASAGPCDYPTHPTGFSLVMRECGGVDYFYLNRHKDSVYIPISISIISPTADVGYELEYHSSGGHLLTKSTNHHHLSSPLDAEVPLQEQETLKNIDYETDHRESIVLYSSSGPYHSTNLQDSQLDVETFEAELEKLE